jgi:hypothetical protein
MRQPVHREHDGELVGYVEPAGSARWRALTLFGGVLAELDSYHEAVTMLNDRGLSCLAQRWWYFSTADQRWRRVQLIEVRPGSVRAHYGPYPQGFETVHITGADLSSLTLALPDGPGGHLPPDYGHWPD